MQAKKAPKTFTIKMTDGSEPMIATIPSKLRMRTKAELSGWAGPPPIDEVEAAVRLWYADRGEVVPPADLEMCRVMRLADATAEKALEASFQADTVKIMASEKPEFGTPAFWAWARARRAEVNADRAAKGLPPLLTAAQKAKAKAEKEAAAAKKS
jgi:hypothetical protein